MMRMSRGWPQVTTPAEKSPYVLCLSVAVAAFCCPTVLHAAVFGGALREFLTLPQPETF